MGGKRRNSGFSFSISVRLNESLRVFVKKDH
jgi:hypothetical protein